MPKPNASFDTTTRHSEQFFDTMDRLMGACIGVIAIRTREVERAKILVHQWASMRESDFCVWNPLTGFAMYPRLPTIKGDASGESSRPEIKIEDDMEKYLAPTGAGMDAGTIACDKAWGRFDSRFKNKEYQRSRFCGVFIGMTTDNMNHAGIQQQIRDHVQRAYKADDRAIIILPPTVTIPDVVAGDVEIIDLRTPSYPELMEALEDMSDPIEKELSITLPDEALHVIVQNGLGMTQQEFENAISLAIVDLGQLIKNTDFKSSDITEGHFSRVVRERKLEVLKQTKVLELMPERDIDDVGGYDLLKEYLGKRKSSFSNEAKEFGIRPPAGIIVVGPPGGGKSLISAMISSVFGVAGIRFDFSRIFGQYIGQSEQQMRAVLEMLEDMAPCVVTIDEIEKMLGSGGTGGDGGTTSRVFGTFLTWMQDRRDRGVPIYIVATANDVTRIPPELLRKGRFDAIFGMSFPTISERIEIARIHVEKRGHELTDKELIACAKESHGWVGAEIESAVEEALLDDFEDGLDELRGSTLVKVIEGQKCQAQLFPERIAALGKWVEENGRPASSESTYDISKDENVEGIVKVNRPRSAKKGIRLRSANSG